MATVIKAGNVASGAQVTSDATGILQFNTGSGAGTTAMTIGTDQSVTFAAGTSINGITVGRGGGSVATNTAVGASALAANTTGGTNSAFGNGALQANTTASNNTAVGYQAGYSNTTGTNNTVLGYSAGNGIITGSNNSGFGSGSIGAASSLGVSGNDNTSGGYQSLYVLSSGANNTALGSGALRSNTTASNNTAVGYQAGYSNTTANSSAFFGYQAGYSNTTAENGTFIGFFAGQASTGAANTFVGSGAGYLVTSGAKNTILGGYNGNQNGLNIRTANNYIVLSDGDGNPRIYNEGTYTNFGYGTVNQGGSIRLQDTAASGFGPVIIGRTGAIGATTDQWFAGSNSAVKGGTTYSTFTVMAGGSGGVNLASGATAWTSASDERLKDIIEPIADAANKVSTLRAVIGKYKTDDEGTRRSFLIAQDVQAVLPEAVSEGRNSKDDETEYLQIAYTEVIPLLVAAIKELKAELDATKAEVAALKGEA